MDQKPQLLSTSTLVLLILIVVIVLAIPDVIGFFTDPTATVQHVTLDDGTKIECVILEETEASGIDCFLENKP